MGLEYDFMEGHRNVGSSIVCDKSATIFLKEKSLNYSYMLEKLAEHSKVSPQKNYKSITNRLQRKLTLIARTTPNSDRLRSNVKKMIDDKNLIPSMMNHPFHNDRSQKVFFFSGQRGWPRHSS